MTDYIRKKIIIKLLEDTMVGSGAGGDVTVDAVAQRDKAGYPMIPVTHIKGLMRDMAQEFGLLEAAKLREMFGKAASDDRSENTRGCLVLTSFYVTEEEKKRGADDFYIVWQSTALENDKKIALEDTLRSFEFVKAGTVFEGIAEFPKDKDTEIERILKKVSAIGHDKTRGSGLVKIKLEEALHRGNNTIPDTKTLRLFLRNRSSVTLPSRSVNIGTDNFITTEKYIHGQRVKGALVQYIVSRFDEKTAKVMFSPGVIVTDALPIGEWDLAFKPEALQEAMIVPNCIQRAKYTEPTEKAASDLKPHWLDKAGKKYYDLLYEQPSKGDKTSRPKEGEVLVRINNKWHIFAAPLVARMRNQIKRQKNESPELFTEEQLVEDIVFACDIHIPADKTGMVIEKMKDLLLGNGFLRLGRGGVPFEVVKIEKGPAGLETKHKINKAEKRYLLFASDAILRDKYLNFYTNVTSEILEEVGILGLTVVDNSHVESVRLSGFNAASNTRRMPRIAIKAGSVVLVEATSDITVPCFIGEENELGFGRIILLEPGIKIQEMPKSELLSRPATRKSRKDVSDLVEAVQKAFSNISKSHLQWVRSELNHLRFTQKEWNTSDLIREIERRSTKLGGKDFYKVPEQLEKINKREGLSNDIFELGLRHAILAKNKQD